MPTTARLIEPQKKIPVHREVDVVVAGSGISGTFAALAAARGGAKTLLIDRFGSLGGNIGPGVVSGGFLYFETEVTLNRDLWGIPKEFKQALEAVRGADPENYQEDSALVSYLAHKLMSEAGVEFLLSARAADPVMDGNRVAGLFVETKSGRRAVTAQVVVDATGDAELAERAGAPIIKGVPPKDEWIPAKVVRESSLGGSFLWNSVGLYMLVGGIDRERARNLPGEMPNGFVYEGSPPQKTVKIVGIGEVNIKAGFHQRMGCALGIGINASGAIDSGNAEHVSRLEGLLRSFAVEVVETLRKNNAGFEKAYVLTMSPFLGARGGPCIDGEYTLTVEDFEQGSRFDDVLYVNYHEGNPPHLGAREGCDVPYRCLLPQKVEGMLVAGRGAAYVRRGHDPTGMRARPNMMILGQAAGMAAALAVRRGVPPKQLPIHALQKELLKEGFHLGDGARLSELGLKE